MGRTPREKPECLAKKLAQIRLTLDLSQDGMIRRLGLENQLTREEISKYERGLRIPSLLTLLRYARVSNLVVDYLIDDDLDLPEKLSNRVKKEGLKRNSMVRSSKRMS